VLQLSTGTSFSLGIPNQGVNGYTTWERIVLSGGLASAGLTVGGNVYGGTGVISSGTALGTAGLVTTGGIVNPWVIDLKDTTFVGYNVAGGAFGGDTGFQPLGAYSTTPTAGSIAFSSNTLGTSTALDTVDITTAQSLVSGTNAAAYALRSNANITLAAGSVASTLTLASGGLIAMTNGISIGAVTANVPDALTLNFGVSGGTEAVIYNTSQVTINAPINATGITKAGSGALLLNAVSPGHYGAGDGECGDSVSAEHVGWYRRKCRQSR
jgi:hypothetical protein